MKILVTGGTGFLGSRLIPDLVESGHTVFALTRSASSHEKLRALGATPIEGDLEAGKPISLSSIDAVVHAAAHFRFAGPRAPYFQTNVIGTTALLESVQKAGATNFIYISAAGIVMDDRGSPIRNVDESAPTYPNSFSGYIASKARAEALVLAANKPGFRTIALRPSAIWGPGDAFSRELPGALKSGQFAFINRGDYPFATCHVDNVVEAIECALERGAGGRAYFINDQETQTFRSFIAMIGSLQNLSIDKLGSMSYGFAFTTGRLMELFAAVTFRKTDPPLSRSLVRMIGRPSTTNDDAARRELGYVGKVSRIDGERSYEHVRAPGGRTGLHSLTLA
jgi:nucleoside-diphosphate-sugar epimerase